MKEKYEKALEAVEKQKVTIERHQKQLDKKVTAYNKASGTNFTAEHIVENADSLKFHDTPDGRRGNEFYWQICEIESKMDDVKNATKKLRERERIASETFDKMNKKDQRNEAISQLPAIVLEFAERYKQLVYDWYIRACEGASEIMNDSSMKYMERRQKVLKYFNGTILQMVERHEEDKIPKIAEKEKQELLEMFVARVLSVTGIIKDAKGLHFGDDGTVNGRIIGEKATVEVNTISAGGWNIQCFHYRVLVKQVS